MLIGTVGHYLAKLRCAATYAVMAVILLLPAIWNGFPFVFADTGGYLIRPFARTLELGRSALYGAFLAAGISLDFWPCVAVQALLCAWMIGLLLRVQGLRHPAVAIAVAAALSVCTSLPWYAGQLMPDVFMPLSALATYLMTFAWPKLRRWEITALAATVAFAVAVHMAILGVMVVLLAVFVGLRLAVPSASSLRPRLDLPAAGIAAGIALALLSNYVIAGAATFTPGGANFLFARLLQDGLVETYLDRNCPNPTLSLCPYRGDKLPTENDEWLWDGDSPLVALGGWRAFAPEAERIVIGSIEQQPLANIQAAAVDTYAQLVSVATGDGFDDSENWHTAWAIRTYAPQAARPFLKDVQQHNAIDFDPLNRLQIPLALGSTLLLPVLIVLFWRRRAGASALALTVFAALLANAAVCATFSGVNDRYQSRIVSIAVLAAALAGYELVQVRRRSTP
ncbi:MAG TPA: hypothetical protein VMF12_14150, partial [Xanthobacteraceae bacterium]|nr:hypothetical protein [Xanthobacteraceae bacterium]